MKLSDLDRLDIHTRQTVVPQARKPLLATWLQRFRTRRQLGKLEPRMLHVLGISKKEALAQASKPFWMA